MFKILANFFRVKTEKQKIDEYLAESISVEDVENRIRLIDRGQAPWQLHARAFSQGWAL
jgi:hypothetical protein